MASDKTIYIYGEAKLESGDLTAPRISWSTKTTAPQLLNVVRKIHVGGKTQHVSNFTKGNNIPNRVFTHCTKCSTFSTTVLDRERSRPLLSPWTSLTNQQIGLVQLSPSEAFNDVIYSYHAAHNHSRVRGMQRQSAAVEIAGPLNSYFASTLIMDFSKTHLSTLG